MLLHLATTLVSLGLAQASPAPAVAEATPVSSWIDLDLDGRDDLVLQLPGRGLKLFLHRGDVGFEDVTERAGAGLLSSTRQASWADVDRDGDPDLLVVRASGALALLCNGGDGSFRRVEAGSGLEEARALSSSWHDFDRDGLPDLLLQTAEDVALWRNEGDCRFASMLVALEAPPSTAEGVVVPGGAVGAGAPGGTMDGARAGGSVDVSAAPGTTGFQPAGPVAAGPTARPERTPRSPRGGRTPQASGPGLPDVPDVSGIQSVPSCAGSLEDQSSSDCILADSTPTPGRLFPLGPDFNIDAATGNVGMGTLTPGYALEVDGQIVSGTGNSAGGVESTVGGGKSNNASGAQATIAGGESNQATGVGATVGGGLFNLAVSDQATVGGGVDNSAGYRAFVGGGQTNDANFSLATVAGGKENVADGAFAAVVGGEDNQATDVHGFVGGGKGNRAGGLSAVAGGENNQASVAAFIGGGQDNSTSENNSSVVGGLRNEAGDMLTFVGGGADNDANEQYSAIVGGEANLADGNHSLVGAGQNNVASGVNSVVTAGALNQASGSSAAVVAGLYNRAEGDRSFVGAGGTFSTPNVSSGEAAVVVGGAGNTASGLESAIVGGLGNTASGLQSFVGGGDDNRATGDYSVVAGGGGSVANQAEGIASVIGGGQGNQVETDRSTIAGGKDNWILASLDYPDVDDYSTIGGGRLNWILDEANYSTISGGSNNNIVPPAPGFGGPAGSFYGTIGGGRGNGVTGRYGTVGGGDGNGASGFAGTVAGGFQNAASGVSASVGGGSGNVASGDRSTVPGGTGNEAGGENAFAAGSGADALHDGSFVWSSGGGSFASTAVEQFLIDAAGGVGIGTNAPAAGSLEVAGAIRSSGSGGGALIAFNPSNAAASAKLDWFNDQARIRIGGSGTGAQNGLDIQTTGDTSLMRIKHDGKVGIGTASPSEDLQVIGDARIGTQGGGDGTSERLAIDGLFGTWNVGTFNSGAGNFYIHPAETTAADFQITPDGKVSIQAGSTISFDLEVNGTAGKPGGGSWSVLSDRRLKKNVADLEQALETLLALRGVTYEYKDPEAIGELAGTRTGFLAQEVEEVLPDWVDEREDGTKYLSIRGFEALVVEALRELRQENRDLRRELDSQRSEREGSPAITTLPSSGR